MSNQSVKNSSISQCFAKLKKEGRIALMPFVMAGDPDLQTSAEILLKLQEKGADIIELGIPYSDPLADGPIIQLAASRALSSGTSPGRVLEMLDSLRGKLTIPLVLFTYSNPLLNRGMERFCDEASAAGAAGLVVPDLPLEEADKLSPIASEKGLDLVLLVAPTTPHERMRRIFSKSNGFTYLVSVTGVTGERSGLENRVQSLIKQLKEFGPSPVAVGFGISDSKDVAQVKNWGGDGAIVGSALVKRISNSAPGCAVDDAGNFCSELRKAAG
ncbi:tryptophan synthase subunit alpha [Prochlorococcus marinus]|uniref:Tryptophan synthase alpha chain n=1 Tax=Prochlorococcus marinus (strain MIT 9211) TaxID=93059 RepID=A9BEJ6_PROM4|nr:tryptophan synthase subunit alpha [Prochlorococcus marinus]ABX08506.1 Tryptophan synthase, alpha subunit [Prochlorococcus marinus str. MIT 9211]